MNVASNRGSVQVRNKVTGQLRAIKIRLSHSTTTPEERQHGWSDWMFLNKVEKSRDCTKASTRWSDWKKLTHRHGRNVKCDEVGEGLRAAYRKDSSLWQKMTHQCTKQTNILTSVWWQAMISTTHYLIVHFLNQFFLKESEFYRHFLGHCKPMPRNFLKHETFSFVLWSNFRCANQLYRLRIVYLCVLFTVLVVMRTLS